MQKISVIIPTFNRQDYILETLDSLRKQSCTDWECIIVDDGSCDNTVILIQKYAQSDQRFSIYKRPDSMQKGANSCRNFGFLKAKGNYIKFLDSDDLLKQDCLERQVVILNEKPEVKVCLSYGRFFDNDTKELKEFWSRRKEYSHYLLGHITNQIRWAVCDPLWRKSFFSAPPFKEGLMNSQEWLMHGEAMFKLKSKEIYNLQKNFSLIRRGNNRMSSKRSSSYYNNQKKSRLYLLQKIGILNFKYFQCNFQLIKQILVFLYWQIKTK